MKVYKNSEIIRKTVISGAVIKSGNAMIVMTAFVVFFSQLTFFISELTAYLNAPPLVDLIFKTLLEVSQACRSASLMNKSCSSAAAVFASAWSGLSFQMQTLALCGKYSDRSSIKKLAFLRFLISVFALVVYTVICSVCEMA